MKKVAIESRKRSIPSCDSSISLLTQEEEGGGGGKKPFHDARIPFSSLDLGGCLRDATGYICMIPEN